DVEGRIRRDEGEEDDDDSFMAIIGIPPAAFPRTVENLRPHLTAVSAGIDSKRAAIPPRCCAGSSKRRGAQPEASGETVRGFFYWFNVLTTRDELSPLPAALVCRGIGCVLCRDRQRRAKAGACLFRGTTRAAGGGQAA